MSMANRIKERRLAVGLTQEELASKLGLQKSAIAKYENGRVENIKRSVISTMASILECSPMYLMGWDDTAPPHPSLRPVSTQKLPVLGNIACGQPTFAEQLYEFTIDAPINADFCLIAKGDSMINARIYDGDVVFIKQQPSVENGEIAVVLIGDEATLKRLYYYREINRLVLQPENLSYKPMVYEGADLEQVRVLGKAVMFQSVVR